MPIAVTIESPDRVTPLHEDRSRAEERKKNDDTRYTIHDKSRKDGHQEGDSKEEKETEQERRI